VTWRRDREGRRVEKRWGGKEREPWWGGREKGREEEKDLRPGEKTRRQDRREKKRGGESHEKQYRPK
jgi:hypothetical protein